MQCPFCHSEIKSGEIVCPSCRAMRVRSVSPVGAIVGWVGVLFAVCTACMWAAVVILPIMGANMHDFPWVVLAVCTVLSVALLWFSRSTRKPRWVQH